MSFFTTLFICIVLPNNHYNFLTCTGHTGPYPDFAAIVAPWYTDPIWQNMLLFPWMDEEALLLSEVYTALEIESVLGVGKTRQLKDYRDVFKNIKSEGTRILVKGDPGIGKTTFTHKISFDWATGELDLFDVVLVLKMKQADCTQTIESIVKEQISSVRDNDVTASLVGEYLRSGRDRVLLVLDGLDEINLKQYPEIKNVLTGRSFRKCCILATTRPHLARELKNKMTSVAQLKGFSRSKAEQFISHIIDDPSERRKFFFQLDRRKMSKMHKVPLIVQALALLFLEKQELPETFTATYDELVFFLRKTCEDSKDLTEDEIKAAMDEVNQLAFKGLTRQDKQLVFSRDEVKNENVFKLGLLSGEKAGSGFKPTTVLQFPHKTFQENCGADHIVRRLEANDRKPWETIVRQFHETFTTDEDQSQLRKPTPELTREETDEELTQTRLLGRAVQKFWGALSIHPNRNAAVIHILHSLMRVGAFDAEIDLASVWDEYAKYPLVVETLNDEEKEAVFDFIGQELLVDTTPDWRAQQKQWVQTLTDEDDERLTTYFLGVQMVVSWIENDPDMAKQKLREMAATFTAQGNLPSQSVSQDFTQLWDHISAYNPLFRFIIGKLPAGLAQQILLEIAVMIVQHALDECSGGVLPFYLLQSLTEDFMKENGLADDEANESFGSQVLLHLNGKRNLEYTQLSPTPYKYAALKISGTEVQDGAEFLNNLISQLNRITNIHIAELEDITVGHSPPTIGKKFVDALYKSPLVSLELRNLDHCLTSYLTQNLPMSLQRLSMSRCGTSQSYHFPPVVNLACLYLEDCTSTIADLAQANFPNIKKLSIINSSLWHQRDIIAVHAAVQTGRMPLLENLYIRFAGLRGFGQQLAEILAHPTLKNVGLLGANLSLADGKTLLKYIQDGRLNHIFTLDLQNNEQLGPMNEELKAACELHQIHLVISPAQQKTSPLATFLPFLNQPSKSGDNTATPPTLDLGALINLAPILLSGGSTKNTSSQIQPQGATMNLGNVLSTGLQLATGSQPPNSSQNPRQAQGFGPSGAPMNLGNVLSTVLQSATGFQPANTTAMPSSNQSSSQPTQAPFDVGNMLTTCFQTVTKEESSDSDMKTSQGDDYMEDDLD